MKRISLKNIKLGYKSKRNQTNVVSKNLNVEFIGGKINVIIGESGCGKTTILRAISGLISPLEGSVYFDDVDVTKYDPSNRGLSYVSQMIGLYSNLSVFNNIAFPLNVSHTPSDEIRERVQEVAEMLKIEHLLSRKPRELSIGQAQRVALARAIIKRSIVYLLDEPFSNLDKKTSIELIQELKQLFSRLNATVIFVSHDVGEALSFADQVYAMHEGNIIFSGTPEQILLETDERITRLLKN